MNFKGKKLMILGAGIYQKPLIKKAKKMGLTVHVCSKMGDYPGIPIAPFFHEVDISNPTKILNLAKKLEIDGILTTATDVCLESIGYVVDELNLSGTGLMDSIACLNKSVMKKRFLLADVPSPDYLEANSIQDAIKFFNTKSVNCVLKPTDSSGSRGVTKIESIDEIESAFQEACKFSNLNKVIIEEWVDGEEFGAQVVVIDKKIEMLIIHSDLTTPPPHRIPIAHGCPHPKEKELLPLVTEILSKAIKALGVNNTICNVDFILSKNGPQIIEMTSRMGGTRLPEVCGKYWGVDLYKLAIKISLGEKPKIPKNPKGIPNAAHNIILKKTGYVEKLGDMDEKHTWKLTIKEGEKVNFNISNLIEIGYIHVFNSDPIKALTSSSILANKFRDTIIILEEN
ncbi:MAG: hypothetical protein CMB64_01270 [Euryarchaeota archaeon]|nr:hypothetical protein [Euryarchaeota archaeon]|tara:strand:- start:163 stop:1356 length:1194 start_codon:yes stop_codon:yes gene_type:complete